MMEHTIGRLQRGLTKALEALERNMECGTPAVEVRADAAMGELAMRAGEQLASEAQLRQVQTPTQP